MLALGHSKWLNGVIEMGLAKHLVTILQGNELVDVSPDVMDIDVDQECSVDSDPQKVTVTLADPEGKYDAGFIPQKDQMRIILYYVKETPIQATPVYNNGIFQKWEMSQSFTEEEFPLFEGWITDTVQDHQQCIIHATDVVGHLSDAITLEYNEKMITNFESHMELLDKHIPEISYEIMGKNFPMNERIQKSITTWQDTTEATRMLSGMVVYSNEEGNHLVMRDPSLVRYSPDYMQHIYDYILNCDDANSVMGFHTVVTVHGKPGKDGFPGAELYLGNETTRHPVLTYTYPDPNSDDPQEVADAQYIAGKEYGELVAPIEFSPFLTTKDSVRNRAKQLFRFYRTFENALTEIDVCGKVPYLHSPVFVVTSSPNLEAIELIGEITGTYNVGDSELNLILLREVVKRKQVKYSGRDFVSTLTLYDKANVGEPQPDFTYASSAEGIGSQNTPPTETS